MRCNSRLGGSSRVQLAAPNSAAPEVADVVLVLHLLAQLLDGELRARSAGAREHKSTTDAPQAGGSRTLTILAGQSRHTPRWLVLEPATTGGAKALGEASEKDGCHVSGRLKGVIGLRNADRGRSRAPMRCQYSGGRNACATLAKELASTHSMFCSSCNAVQRLRGSVARRQLRIENLLKCRQQRVSRGAHERWRRRNRRV